ncbi:hypothetical protein CTAM01_07054 [Colletotrichum tamarilloi]|uniref:Uncharacterized protein n=1 Tax=Colletotrichum tamarilloi TaxID=1209934 RepID=A0ABQ9R9T9_9PEZI|nr:uncharacterized protein CTAM01_07054 [Colletotrichum tamarilloi]KAK1499133.1 hypothetical protein CTAM01_07054 [Colletotrichum tamarilloi]
MQNVKSAQSSLIAAVVAGKLATLSVMRAAAHVVARAARIARSRKSEFEVNNVSLLVVASPISCLRPDFFHATHQCNSRPGELWWLIYTDKVVFHQGIRNHLLTSPLSCAGVLDTMVQEDEQRWNEAGWAEACYAEWDEQGFNERRAATPATTVPSKAHS